MYRLLYFSILSALLFLLFFSLRDNGDQYKLGYSKGKDNAVKAFSDSLAKHIKIDSSAMSLVFQIQDSVFIYGLKGSFSVFKKHKNLTK